MEMEEALLGKVTHHFSKIGVGVIEITGDVTLKKGDTIHVKGATTDFEQKIESMQVNHKEVIEAKKGDAFGLKVKGPVREHDAVYKVV
jgi:translation elongation factor EF-1alpha